MEHISDILKKQKTPTNTSKANTGTWSGAEAGSPETERVCSLCRGAGFVYLNVPVGHPEFGKAVPCRCTLEQFARDCQSRLEHYSNLGTLSRFTFDNIVPEGRSGDPANQERFRRVYQTAREFAASPRGWLVLVGPSGCGKTHLAAAIARERIKSACPAFFQNVPDLLDHLRAAFNPESEIPYDELFERVRSAPLLILDDLGAQSATAWAREKLDQLLNHRFNSELPTVITTSHPLDEFEDRMRARLTDPRLSRVFVIEEKLPLLPEYGWGPGFELQKTMTFKTYQRRPNLPQEQQENLENLRDVALSFARSPEGWLVLQGVTGCGKTHLAASIANFRYEAAQPALFIVVPDFLDHLRSTFSPDSKVSYDQLSERVKTTPLLILDDFGEHSTTPWAKEKLYQIINYRYNARAATVITTRWSLDDIDSPISSRFVDPKISMVWNITAPDYRGDVQSHKPARQAPPPRRAKKERWE